MKKSLHRILAMAACLCLLLTACGGNGDSNGSGGGSDGASSGDGTSGGKDTMVIAAQADMADKDPINGSTTNDTIKIKAQVYETLIERTVPDQEYRPLLAEKWEFNDDATELTITLREGIQCHNGETLTAEDCLFSLQCLRESANKSVTDHMDLEKSYAVDERTFVIVMDEPYMPIIANLSYPTCVMFSKKGYEEADGDWANMDVGTGPYTWGEWSIGSSVKLIGFDDYYVEGQPAIKNVEFKVISEDGNRYIEVETGGADLCYNLSGVDIAAAEANADVEIFREFTMDNCYLSFNHRNSPFNDVRVRLCPGYRQRLAGLHGRRGPARQGPTPRQHHRFHRQAGFPLSRGLPRLPVQPGEGQGAAGRGRLSQRLLLPLSRGPHGAAAGLRRVLCQRSVPDRNQRGDRGLGRRHQRPGAEGGAQL